MKEMTCRELVKEVAKIIYIVHDEVKDKAFELELSWVGEVTNGRHQLIPEDVRQEAEKYAKVRLHSSYYDYYSPTTTLQTYYHCYAPNLLPLLRSKPTTTATLQTYYYYY
ncbi:proteasome subunit alpha type-3-like, partial [Anarrhichthys ocellatus]|uniref:proteasome subunit alpha type-3-like n=1 Tax=Anarrhichthys ocellatus TaxID=433405 RepID=UPI0012ED67E6